MGGPMTGDEVQAAVLHKLVSIQASYASYEEWAKYHYKKDPVLLEERLADNQKRLALREKAELEKYATVQVLRRKAGWVLVYAGDDIKEATGGFPTRKKAEHWFLTGGR